MANQSATKDRILVAQDEAMVAAASPHVAAIAHAPDLVPVGDGARCVVAYTKLLRASQPPLLVVLDDGLERIDGPGTARVLRAIERAMDQEPVAILFYSDEAADDERKALLSELTRAVHLQRRAQEPVEAQGRRLAKATAKLLGQVRGR